MSTQKKFLLIVLVWSGLLACSASGQKTVFTPKETVEQLWGAAARGDLLTSSGWNRASAIFTKSTTPPGNRVILVVSNSYGVTWVSVEGKSAKVRMAHNKLGRIDSRLRFTREPRTNAYETDEEYHLISSLEYSVTLPDGKPNPDNVVIWRIDGSPLWPPWATVNTAIRYVLEQRAKATDPVVRKNADDTIQKLLALH